jgi:hypothetical protein
MADFVKILHPDLPAEYECPACVDKDDYGKRWCYVCGGRQVIRRAPSEVPRDSLDHWRSLGWRLVDDDGNEIGGRPAKNAGKPEWVEYAAAVGVENVEDKTRAELIAAVDQLELQPQE